MSAPPVLFRSARVPGRVSAALAGLAVALAAAFVVAPRMLAGGGIDGRRELVRDLRASFEGYWASGERDLSPELDRVVDYWFRYHLVKAAIAAILLVVLVRLGVLAWKAFLNADANRAGRRTGLGLAGVLVTGLAVVSLAAVMANIQGAVAPFASLLPMLVAGASGARLTGELDQIRQQLAERPNTGHSSPAVEAMISDFALYHAAIAVIAAVVAAVLIGVSAMLWRRFALTSGRARRVLGSYGALTALLSLGLVVLTVANTTTAMDPAPALLAFFEGGW